MEFFVLIFVVVVVEIIFRFAIHMSCFIARKIDKPICACWDCKKPCKLWKYKNFNSFYVYSYDVNDEEEYYEYCTFFENVKTKEIVIVKDSEYTLWKDSFQYKNNEYIERDIEY